MEKEHNRNDAHDDALKEQVALESVNRGFDQGRTIISGMYLHSLRQRRRDLRDFSFDSVNDVKFQDAASNLIRAGTHSVNHHRKRDSVGEQLVGIEPHLVLPYKTPDGRNFSDARNRFELVANLPVLEAA